MCSPRNEDWKKDYPEDAADLEWWEEAFGKGNVRGWTYRHAASVYWAGKVRSVDAQLRDWVAEAEAEQDRLRAALDVSNHYFRQMHQLVHAALEGQS